MGTSPRKSEQGGRGCASTSPVLGNEGPEPTLLHRGLLAVMVLRAHPTPLIYMSDSRFGGLSAGPMPTADREWVEAETRRRSMIWPPNVPASTDAQIAESAALAVDMYELAQSYGITRGVVDGVTSLIDSAIDAIRVRDRS